MARKVMHYKNFDLSGLFDGLMASLRRIFGFKYLMRPVLWGVLLAVPWGIASGQEISSGLDWSVSLWQSFSPKAQGSYIGQESSGALVIDEKETFFGGSVEIPMSFLFSGGVEFAVDMLPDQRIGTGDGSYLLAEKNRRNGELNLVYHVGNHISLLGGMLLQKYDLVCLESDQCQQIDQQIFDLHLLDDDFGWLVGAQWSMPIFTDHSWFGIRAEYQHNSSQKHCVNKESQLLDCDVTIMPDDNRFLLKALVRFGF